MDEKNKEKLMEVLLEQVSKLTKDIEDLKKNIPTAEQLSTEVLSNQPFVPAILPKKLTTGKKYRQILESEIREIQKTAESEIDVARKLGVCYSTYKKYAKMYGIHGVVKNQQGKGLKRKVSVNKGKYPLADILANKYPDYPLHRFRDRLIKTGIKPNCCEQCSYGEGRITDGKVPLLIVFEDGNHRNKVLENIKLLCYNCCYTTGRIWMKIRDKIPTTSFPDIQTTGSNQTTIITDEIK